MELDLPGGTNHHMKIRNTIDIKGIMTDPVTLVLRLWICAEAPLEIRAMENIKEETSLRPIIKNHYKEHADVTSRAQTEIDDWLSTNKVTMKGNNIPRPVFSFGEANFNPRILRELSNFQTPTSIQSISWPVLMSGLDIISIAQTGSGKTLAYMLPALEHMSHQNLPKSSFRSPRSPTILVLVPTRELAQQVSEVSKSCIKASNLQYATLFGGVSKFAQEDFLAKGVDVVVATPGRLLDHLNTKTIDLRNCSYVVLDEADRMLDMGFEPQVRSVLSQIRPDRQTAMFSATWPKEVQKLARDFLKDEVFLNVGSMELSANPDIKQIVEVVDGREKRDRLKHLIENIFSKENNKTLIFVQTKVAADRLATFLGHFGHKALSLHGDKTQLQRDTIMQRFRRDASGILIATDVAARGLDVDDIEHVINFDYPNNSEDYVHRIGRTGRAGRTGVAYSFVTPEESHKVPDLIEVLQETQQEIPRSLLDLHAPPPPSFKRRSYR
ncbi:unnamed protein product, partial [Mesorhabditis belari]|uniref:RNA helicase n=1 Tax=Mesorhabditis belari TaxID=2138241 RepID=A0AAF3F619_9BILA